jgi:hypothetical protein
MGTPPDLKCTFDAAAQEGVIWQGGKPAVLGVGLQDAADGVVNRVFGAKPGENYSGTAYTAGGGENPIGDFNVTKVSADKIICSAPGFPRVPGRAP